MTNMTYSRLSFLALALALVAAASARRVHISPDIWYAAECASLGRGCRPNVARASRYCRAYVWMTSQPKACQDAACKYCRKDWRRKRLTTCNRPPIVKNCFNNRAPHNPSRPMPKPAYKPQPAPHMPSSKHCAWRGNNGRVYIPATSMPYRHPWVRRGNHIVWKPNGGPTIDRKGSGEMCVDIVPDQSGRYYYTARTAAPMRGEHNDLWMAISSGMDHYRPSHRSFRPGKSGKDYTKAYHPVANNYEETYYTFTIDHNPHQFITKPLVKGRRYKVCIAGRSSRFRVFAVVLVRCTSIEGCSYFSNYIKGRMANKTPSKCY